MIINGKEVRNVFRNGELISEIKRNNAILYKNTYNKSLVDAWFMSGYSNSNHPTSIDGINSTKTYPVNFKEIYGTKNNIQEHKVTLDAVNNFVSNSGDLNEGDTFTIPSYMIKVTGMIDVMMTIGYEDNTGQHFLITIQKDGIYTVPAHTFSWNEFMPIWVTSIATYFHGDGDFSTITIEEVAEDKVNTLALKNFAFSEGSGFGKYNVNFISYKTAQGQTDVDFIKTDSYYKLISTGGSSANSFLYTTGSNLIIPPTSYKITNIPSHVNLIYKSENQDGFLPNVITIKEDGVYDIPEIICNKWTGWWISGAAANQKIGLTIEQIPEYEGALVFDGVDDRAVCDTIPALSDYTAIYKREYVL